MSSLNRCVWVIAMALGIGCGSGGHSHGEHGHSHGGHGGHGEGDGHEEEHPHSDAEVPAEVVTLWGEATQLFVEFPALIVGEESPFAAHLTRLSDHRAIASGSVVVELRGDSVERFEVDAPSIPGIFRPIVTPASAGRREVVLILESDEATETHAMGSFEVFASVEAAIAAAEPEEDAPGEIVYFLEQQWKVPFGIAEVRQRSLRPSLEAFGELVAAPESEALVTAPRDGRLEVLEGRSEAALRIGSEVEAGQSLFRIASVPSGAADRATLDQGVAEANAAVTLARQELERLRPLVASGVVAARRQEQAEAALSIAEASLRGAQRRSRSLAQSQRVRGRQDALGIPAPIAGEITELLVAPGSWVRAGQPLARIASRDQLHLLAQVPEAYASRIGAVSGAWFRPTREAPVVNLGPESVLSIGARVDPQHRTLPLRFALPSRASDVAGRFFAGTSAMVQVIVDAPRPGLAVPRSALVDDAGADVVFVQRHGEGFERRLVRLGIVDGDVVEITSGLEEGEWVVSEGAYGVKLASTAAAPPEHGHAH